MLIQRVVTWRYVRLGYIVLSRFHDAVNAFWSISHRAVTRDIAPPFTRDARDRELMRQRVEGAVLRVETFEGHIDLRVGEGVMPGDHAGPRLFNNTYCMAMARALMSYAAKSESAGAMVVASPFDGRKAYLGATGFVDDIGAKVIAKSIDQMVSESSLEQACVAEQTGGLGIALHEGKQENVFDAMGVGSRGVIARLYSMHGLHGRNTNDARYLGGRQVHGLSFAPEKKLRLAAMQKGWAMLGRFWTSRAHFRIKRSAFLCIVVGAAMSGLEACAGMYGPIRAAEMGVLERQVVRYLRAMMRGAAAGREVCNDERGGETLRYRSMTNDAVLKHWRVAPLFTELRVRRLKWLQTVAADVGGNVQLLAALFGEIEGAAVLDDEGRVVRQAASPWARQLEDDILGLAVFDDGACFLELVCVDERPSFAKVLVEFAEDFKYIDVSTLRAVAMSSSIPPVGVQCEGGDEAAHADAGEGHTCECMWADGRRCGLGFPTRRSLLAHQRFADGGTHGVRILAHRATVCNQCPACMSVFRSRFIAARHVGSMMLRGRCCLDRAVACGEVVPPASLECPLCDECGQYDTLEDLQRHISEQLLGSGQGHQFIFPSWECHVVAAAGEEEAGGEAARPGQRQRRACAPAREGRRRAGTRERCEQEGGGGEEAAASAAAASATAPAAPGHRPEADRPARVEAARGRGRAVRHDQAGGDRQQGASGEGGAEGLRAGGGGAWARARPRPPPRPPVRSSIGRGLDRGGRRGVDSDPSLLAAYVASLIAAARSSGCDFVGEIVQDSGPVPEAGRESDDAHAVVSEGLGQDPACDDHEGAHPGSSSSGGGGGGSAQQPGSGGGGRLRGGRSDAS